MGSSRRFLPKERAVGATEGRSPEDEGARIPPSEAPIAGGGRAAAGAQASAARDAISPPEARRSELADRLAEKGGGAARGARAGPVSSNQARGGWEVAEAGGDSDGEPEGDGDVLLSLPLAGDTEAEGSLQPMSEENLKVDPETGKVEFREDSVLAFPDAGNIQPNAGTISFEVEPDWNGTDPGDNSFVQVRGLGEWQGKMALFRNGSGLRFVLIDEDGNELGVTADIKDWRAGEKHNVAASWDSDVGVMSIYVDGKLVQAGSYSSRIEFAPGTPLFVGSNPRHHVPGAGAALQNFKVYGRALDPEEIVAGTGAKSGAGEP